MNEKRARKRLQAARKAMKAAQRAEQENIGNFYGH
jgi:hypothetical protein